MKQDPPVIANPISVQYSCCIHEYKYMYKYSTL